MSNRRLINLVCMLTITSFCMGVATSTCKTRCIERERQALLSFKQGLKAQSSGDPLSWGEDEDCCLWTEIGCDCATGHVTRLDLEDANLTGEIRPSLLELRHLNILDLSYNNFNSTPKLPEFFGLFTNLTHLKLSSCGFRGSIPDTFGNLTSLKELNLSSNLLQGGIPKSLGDFCNLESLDLSDNNFSQQISETLLNLMGCAQDSLETLSLSRNQFKGSLPSEVARFSSLQQLYLDSNQLNGSLPESQGKVSSLVGLDASSNSLSGVISETHLSNLSNLNQLDLSFNSLLTLNVSSTWVPCSQLEILRLASCKLGPHFPGWLRTQKGFSELDISNSQISLPIPDWFWINLSYKLVYLNLSFNQIPGTVPNLKRDNFLYPPTVDLSSNLFNGPIPGFLSGTVLLNLAKNMFSGSIQSFLCNMTGQGINYLDLSDNQLSGNLPDDCWFPLKKTLSILNLENNKFSGTIPTSMGSLSQLQTLCLRNNNFSGQLSLSLKGWQRLKLLDIGDNYFSGKIPSWIGESLKGLVVLRLASNGFDGDIPLNICHLQSLRVLDLSLNKLSGSIPSCLNNFTAMAHNDPLAPGSTYIPFLRRTATCIPNTCGGIFPNDPLAPGSTYIPFPPNDRFTTGSTHIPFPRSKAGPYCNNPPSIPNTREERHCFAYSFKRPIGNLPIAVNNALFTWKGTQRRYGKNLGLLRAIDLSSNTLNGEIPQQVTSLVELRALNLSRNQLNGTIPTNIGQLKILESLDLSMNRLGGGLPDDLSKLSSLSYLDLSNNSLSGKIPSSTQLQSFNATSYIPNSQLCGPPLLNQCPGDETKNDHPSIGTGENSQQEDKWFEGLWFYTGMTSGFTSGLLGVCGSLLLNTSWRRAYFDFLTTMWDFLYITTVMYKARFQRRLQELI